MTCYGHSLSPPEGYIAHNFAKQFHVDKHWTGSPGGAYWNLKPGTPTHQADMEYGANFFISDYGLRRNCELQKCLCYLEYFIVASSCMVRVGIMMAQNNLKLLLY